MDERESTRAEIEHSRERVKDIATQLAHRAQPTYVKEKAKEVAVNKSVELRDRIADSPMALGIIGGLATALIAKGLHRRRHDGEIVYERVADEPGEETLRERAAEKMDDVKQRAGELKEKAAQGVHNLRARMPSRDEVKARARDITDRGRQYASEEPLITALGAIAIGAAVGFLLPLSDRERRALRPAREKVSEKLETIASDVNEKVEAGTEELRERIQH